ncbi:MAG: cytochrome c oxidase subunit II [Solirubrobacterales bacterium]|nr:cytochrome c oxidase subunit II [Solirubrobacterales bacterium]
MTRGTYVKLVAVMLALAAVISVLMLQIEWFGDADSAQAGPIDTLFDVSIVLSSLVFSIVMVMLIYAIWKWRARPGDESDGAPIHGNTRLEVAWTAIPTAIVLVVAIYSWIVLNDIEAKASDRMPLHVTAQQFKWTFEYPEAQVGKDSGGEPTYLTTSQLHVPVDRQLEVTLSALDVVHSFWVPEWRIKRDAVPAGASGDEIDDEFVVTPDKEGTYALICTEYCGTGHSTMRATVVVESQQEFDQWVARETRAQKQSASASGGGSSAGQGGT